MAAALQTMLDAEEKGENPFSIASMPVLEEVTRRMGDSGDTAYVPILIDIMRFQFHPGGRRTIGAYLARLIGEDAGPDPVEQGDWGWWVEWLSDHPEVTPPKGYAGWKGRLLSFIDPDMGAFFYDGIKTRVRLEEAVWGGVPKDGIPDLTNPPVVSAAEAVYLEPTDRVFGVSINGEHRAYPLRILNPHEMANDVLGGVPIALAN